MNLTFSRLIDGMIATLRSEVIPATQGDFARGQAFGVIYMLETIKRRADWSNALIGEQLAHAATLGQELAALAPGLAGAPLPSAEAAPSLPTAEELAKRQANTQAEISTFIDWLAAEIPRLDPAVARAAEAAVSAYLLKQSRTELAATAKPMFDAISRGAE